MTEQLYNSVIYKEEYYSLSGLTDDIQFITEDAIKLGIPAEGDKGNTSEHRVRLSSGCHRGYRCTLIVRDNTLLIKKIECNSPCRISGVSLGNYFGDNTKKNPIEVYGVKPEFDDDITSDFAASYNNINHKIEYNGSILISNEYSRKVGRPDDFQTSWLTKTTFELEFENGILIKEFDISSEIDLMRKTIPRKEMKTFIFPNAGDYVDHSIYSASGKKFIMIF